MKTFIKTLAIYFFIVGCSSTKTLQQTNNAPDLHDKYKIQVDRRIYGVLPLPDEFYSDTWVEYNILERPRKGNIDLVDRYKGFFTYVPREGMVGYDFIVYKVSDGQRVYKKIIQFNIK